MNNLEFDYVIVGAGSAGCVLADRLSESGKHSVLLLEAGGTDARFWIKVPIGYAINYANPAVGWGYTAAPDAALNNRSIYWPRGRVIGGSGSLNAMAYVRGLARDFDDWEAAGAIGWDWSTVARTYARMETHSEIGDDNIRRTRGDGPLWVSDLSDQMSPFSQNFIAAAQDAGLPVISDMNAPDADGVSYYRSSVRNGVRWSSADAFLRPAQRRANLTILKHADVERLHSTGTRVTGLSYSHRGKQHTVTAHKEVIISAGAVNSPKLLQLSGFGPAELLRRHGIEVMHDLPEVGKGLQDHLAIAYQFRANQPTLNNRFNGVLKRLSIGLQYVLTRKGPMAVPVNQVGGFIRSQADQDAPDVQLYCNPASYDTNAAGKTTLDSASGYLICAQPCRPTSRGSIEIASPSNRDAPVIAPNSLSTPEDQASAIAAGKLLQRLAETPSLRAVTTSPKAPDLRGLDDADLLEDFRQRASTVYHPTCTCRMGSNAQDSVLDSRLRVHGVAGLRVVDASAFPNITSGNTNAPTMMLAMQAADYILEDAG